MNPNRDSIYYSDLVQQLKSQSLETEWVEFKVNKGDPEEIGEYISALANSAALVGKLNAYVIWGVEDTAHEIVGTTFRPKEMKIGNEELENWLHRSISPSISFNFIELKIGEKYIVVLEIDQAVFQPIRFKTEEFIRVGSYKKKLKDHPEKERELWRVFESNTFEQNIAMENVPTGDVLRLLDYPAYFELLDLPLPAARDSILDALATERMIERCETGNWNILNMGAILIAKKLDSFNGLARKAVRVVIYHGKGRVETIREQDGTKGYASGFEGLIGFINNLLPSNEVVGKALRNDIPMYPELAVRELVANALIHQDFTISGTGPMIEVFDDRMEITNPGIPLVDVVRFLDSPPRSRNEALASFMRRIGVCEERGSGIDKVVTQTEIYQLPAPVFESLDQSTRSILFGQRPMNKMSKDDRIRACYLHACLKHVMQENMTNTSVRQRFGIESKNSGIATRIIKATIATGLVYPHDELAGRKYMKYIPFWAK